MALKREGRNVNKLKYVAAFSLACLIFAGGMLGGYYISQGKVNDILNVEREARLQLETLDLEEKLFENAPCINPSLLSANLDDLGAKLTFLESNYEKNDPRVLELKKPYTLLEVRHYLTLKNMIERCGKQNYTLIMFFYSNSPDRIKESEKQGFVLNYIQKKFTTDKVKIYSFDTDLDMDMIKTLMDVYGIGTVPSMIIDGKLYMGFHDTEELENAVGNKWNAQ